MSENSKHLGFSFANQRHSVCPIVAEPAEHTHPLAIAAADERNPSCLISKAHCGPVGTVRPLVGKQGSIKPGGRRTGDEERQSMVGLHSGPTR